MSKQQLTQLLIKGDKPYRYKDQIWYIRYNHVIDVYNQNYYSHHHTINNSHLPQSNKQNTTNQISDKVKPILLKLYCPYNTYIFTSFIINNYLLNIAMVLIFTFIPIINIITEILLISYTLFLKKQTHKHKINLSKVQDPFENFYYYPQMCKQLEKHFTTLNLTIDQIENFKFNQSSSKLRQSLLNQQNSKITNHQKQGQNLQKKKKNLIKVPIYDQYFYDSFFLVRKQYFKAISWSVLGIILLGLNILFYSAIYQDLTN